jgi:ComF family protein
VALAREELQWCLDCLDERPPYSQLRAIFDYHGLIADYLKRFKYDQNMLYGQVVMRLFWNGCGDELRQLSPMTLIPAPSHRDRLKIRGFNQAYQIARFLSQQLKWPLNDRCLIRKKSTQSQHSLNKEERRKNLRDAFVVKGPAPKHVVIVDDIVTTGATVGAIAQALRLAGSETIEVWCMARTSKGS